MKKTLLFGLVFAVLLIVPVTAWAQRPVGDTLVTFDTDYLFSPYLDWFSSEDTGWRATGGFVPFLAYNDFWYNCNTTATCDGNHIGGMQWYTDHPVKIVGIAACAQMRHPSDTTLWSSMGAYHLPNHDPELFFLNTRDTTLAGRITDSLILYKPTPTGLVKLMDGPWRIEQPHRYMVLPPQDSIYAFTSDVAVSRYFSDTNIVASLYEVMFPKPVVVEDSFVVAGTAFNNDMTPGLEHYPGFPRAGGENMRLWDHNATRYWLVRSPCTSPDPDTNSIAWVKYQNFNWHRHQAVARHNPYVNGDWRFDISTWGNYSYVMFPIIEPEFDTVLCHEVSNLRVAERGAGCATLMWDSGDGGPWEVAYGKIDDNWEDFTIDTVTAPMITLTRLEVGTQYFAFVRGFCSVTGEYGEWSSPLEVEVYQPWHEEPEGIESASDLGRYTRLIPNPARGVVNVVSSFRLSRIEVYDLNGRKVLEQEADGISTMVDVSGLSSGTYIAALYLPHGVATKKLVVE